VLEGGAGKKLKDWIRWQLSADGPGPEYCRSCRAKRRSDDRCEPCPEVAVFPENVPAVDLFLDVQTQWRVGLGGAIGLDYVGVEAAARLLGVPLGRDLFERLQVLEMSYLGALGEKAEETPAPKPAESPRSRVNVRQGKR
jgi:hypothetical protein